MDADAESSAHAGYQMGISVHFNSDLSTAYRQLLHNRTICVKKVHSVYRERKIKAKRERKKKKKKATRIMAQLTVVTAQKKKKKRRRNKRPHLEVIMIIRTGQTRKKTTTIHVQEREKRRSKTS